MRGRCFRRGRQSDQGVCCFARLRTECRVSPVGVQVRLSAAGCRLWQRASVRSERGTLGRFPLARSCPCSAPKWRRPAPNHLDIDVDRGIKWTDPAEHALAAAPSSSPEIGISCAVQRCSPAASDSARVVSCVVLWGWKGKQRRGCSRDSAPVRLTACDKRRPFVGTRCASARRLLRETAMVPCPSPLPARKSRRDAAARAKSSQCSEPSRTTYRRRRGATIDGEE